MSRRERVKVVQYDRDFDITKTIKIIEWLKAQLLADVSQLFSGMVEGSSRRSDEHIDTLANMIILIYLLGKKLGVSYDALDVKVLNKLKLGMLESDNTTDWLADLAMLSRHLDKTRDLDRR